MDTNALHPKLTAYEQTAQRQREKLAFVEHICGVMIEDRFDGDEPPRPWRVFHGDVESMFSKAAVYDLMPDWAFEFIQEEFVFSRFASMGSARPGAEIAGFIGPNQQAGSFAFDHLSVGRSALSPSTLGRGSPITFGTQPLAAVPQRSAVRLA